jgi:flagellum-specific ATP synthase
MTPQHPSLRALAKQSRTEPANVRNDHSVPVITLDSLQTLTTTRLHPTLSRDPIRRFGHIIRAGGDILHAAGLRAPIGASCLIATANGATQGEIIGFEAGHLLIMAEQGTAGILPGARFEIQNAALSPLMGDALLGRVLNARGTPLDGQPPPHVTTPWPLAGTAINPLTRARIDQPFDSGITTINALATLGRGMRTGLFAGSGVGKTTLLGMIARHAAADIVVIGMIGERGREIREFIEDHIGPALPRSVVIASPADDTALARIHAAWRAAATAEYFRAQGKHVLLLVDSLTRLAMALREIGLAAGEPAATRGYPPSVFGAIAAYVERAGNTDSSGSITAIYTVLVEADDHVGDPVADTARAVLDGHIILSRAMAEAAIYPPIEIAASLSRPMPALVDAEHLRLAARFRTLWTHRRDKQDMIDLGAYTQGRDATLDEALRRAPAMDSLLRQNAGDYVSLSQSRTALEAVFIDP